MTTIFISTAVITSNFALWSFVVDELLAKRGTVHSKHEYWTQGEPFDPKNSVAYAQK